MNEEFATGQESGGRLDRASVLLEQERYELAERELRRLIAEEPGDVSAHALLGVCLSEQKKYKAAAESAQLAVHLDPTYPYAYYALAYAYHQAERLHEAESTIGEAIRLDPEQADYYALLSSVKLQRRRWREALEAAERGLYFESEHVGCINLRAMALNQLGLADDAAVAVEGALSVEPENALTHANRGWQEVHRGRYDRAMEHFREALRIDAQLEWAREGVAEVLKARNPVYRVMLRYFLWSSRLSGRSMWMFIVGFFLLSRLLRVGIRTQPELAPLLWPVYGLYLAFVLLTWIARPLFDLLLRLDPVGRVALTRQQITASNAVGGAILTGFVSLVVGLLTGAEQFYMFAAAAGMMTVPIAGAFGADAPRARRILRVYAAALGSLALVAFALSFLSFTTALAFASLFLVGFFIYGWVANALAIRT